jgi:hypothetical protein
MSKSLVLILVLFATVATASNHTASFCDLCETGNCTRAYKGSEGQWCGNWMSGDVKLSCCCPKDSICASRSASECSCEPNDGYASLWALGVIVGICLFGGCIAACCCDTRRNRNDNDPYAYTVGYHNRGDNFTLGVILGNALGGDGGGCGGFAGDF